MNTYNILYKKRFILSALFSLIFGWEGIVFALPSKSYDHRSSDYYTKTVDQNPYYVESGGNGHYFPYYYSEYMNAPQEVHTPKNHEGSDNYLSNKKWRVEENVGEKESKAKDVEENSTGLVSSIWSTLKSPLASDIVDSLTSNMTPLNDRLDTESSSLFSLASLANMASNIVYLPLLLFFGVLFGPVLIVALLVPIVTTVFGALYLPAAVEGKFEDNGELVWMNGFNFLKGGGAAESISRAFSSNECVERISCEIVQRTNNGSRVGRYINWFADRLSSKKYVSNVTKRAARAAKLSARNHGAVCESYSCDPWNAIQRFVFGS